MADEQAKPSFNKASPIPKGKDWPALLSKDGDELEVHYRHTLEELGKRSGYAIRAAAPHLFSSAARCSRSQLPKPLCPQVAQSSLGANIRLSGSP